MKKFYLILILIIFSYALIKTVMMKQIPPAPSSPASSPAASLPLNISVTPSQNLVLGAKTKDSGCTAQNSLPDSACTPGAVFTEVTKDQICIVGYSKNVRNVSNKTKDEVFRQYGVVTHETGEYEVDHLVSLELGGSNDISNLWPEAAEPRPGYHEKDRVENYLHDQVCKGLMDLKTAQQQISQNWLEIYNAISK